MDIYQNNFIIKYAPQYSEGIYRSIDELLKGEGTVYEIGTGLFSTPYLHERCKEQGRILVSYETDQNFFGLALNYQDGFHNVYKIDDYKDLKLDGCIFIDSFPIEEREAIAANCNGTIIIHDK